MGLSNNLGKLSNMITSTGSAVGIGTASPADLLEVKGGNIRLSAIAGVGPQFNLYSNGQTSNHVTLAQGFALSTDNIGYLYNRANADFVFGTNNTERMRITSTGNVGIGSSSPTAKLTIVKASHTSTLGASSVLQISDTGASGEAVGDRAEINFYTNSDSLGGNLQHATIGIIKTSTTGNETADLYFATSTIGGSPVERMRITSGGNVFFQKTSGSTTSGIGGAFITDPAAPWFSVVGNSNYIYFFNQDAVAYRFYVTGAGVINATSTSITAISDISLKENIRDLETGLSEIMKLKPRRFDWKEETKIGEKNVAGFIAQELEEVLPELVYDYQYNDNEIKKSVKMGDILPTLVKAIQEQQAQIQNLQEQNQDLKSRLDKAGL